MYEFNVIDSVYDGYKTKAVTGKAVVHGKTYRHAIFIGANPTDEAIERGKAQCKDKINELIGKK